MNPFDGWDPVPAPTLFAYPPFLFSPVPQGLFLFAVDAGGQLRACRGYYSLQPHWPAWESIVDGAVGRPAAVTAAEPHDEYRIDVFVVGVDSTLWHVAGTSGPSRFQWGAPASLGGVLRPDVAAVCTGPGQFDVFGRGLDGRLWHLATDGTTSTWDQREGMILSTPSAVAWSPTEVQLVALGPRSDLLHQWLYRDTGTWSGWESLGGQLSSPPVMVARTPQLLDVFARGTDATLQHRYWNGESWGTRFAQLGGGAALSDGPTADALGSPPYIEVAVSLLDHTAGRLFWDGRNWGTTTSQGGLCAVSPTTLAGELTPDVVETTLLAYGVDGMFHTRTWISKT